MFRIASAAVLIASAVSLVSAQAYVSFDLDATVEPTFADPLEGLLFVDGSPDTGRANCNAIDNCLGVICGELHRRGLAPGKMRNTRSLIRLYSSSAFVNRNFGLHPARLQCRWCHHPYKHWLQYCLLEVR